MYLDANVFVFARVDLGPKGERARQIIKKISKGQLLAVTSTLAVDELIWAVRRELKSYSKAIEWAEQVMVLPLKFNSVTYADMNRALNFIKSGLKPRDSIHAAVALNSGIKEILSDDPDFSQIEGLHWKAL